MITLKVKTAIMGGSGYLMPSHIKCGIPLMGSVKLKRHRADSEKNIVFATKAG